MSVLLSAALLITGHGLQLTLLPLQAHTLGWSSDLIGLTGATYYLGFVLGCLFIPRVIRQVGHIRTFTVFVSIACISVVIAESIPHWLVWTHVRLASGLAISEPCHIVQIVEIIAALKDVKAAEVADAAWSNSLRLFKLDLE